MAFTAQADAATVTELLAESGLQTLVDGLPHALSQQGPARHWMQAEFTKMVQAAAQDLRRSAGAHREQLQAQVEAAEGAIKEGEAALGAAAEEETASGAVVEERLQTLKQCRAALETTKAERVDAEAARERVEKLWQELEQQKNEVGFLLDGPFRMLLDGGWEDDETRESTVESVTQLLSGLKAETALVAAATQALGVRPESRSEFDEFTLTETKRVLEERAASLDAKLQEEMPAREDARAVALGLLALAERESNEEGAAEMAWIEASRAAEKASEARKEAAAELERRREALGARLSAKALEEERAKRIDTALEAAERLVEFEYSAPEPSAADAPADGAMATEEPSTADAPADSAIATEEPSTADAPADSAKATEDAEMAAAEPETDSKPAKFDAAQVTSIPRGVPTPSRA